MKQKIKIPADMTEAILLKLEFEDAFCDLIMSKNRKMYEEALEKAKMIVAAFKPFLEENGLEFSDVPGFWDDTNDSYEQIKEEVNFDEYGVITNEIKNL